MSYENAPATKLLATACACCGRALVDAISVETGIGPECRKHYGVAFDTTDAAHAEANALVFQVARKGMTAATAQPIFDRLAALGFTVLADRIAKRFRTTVTKVDVDALRAEYRQLRAAFCYDNCTPAEFDAIVKDAGANDPVSFVAEAHAAKCDCKRCDGSGEFRDATHELRGPCFRCDGKGYQVAADVHRNRAYDAHRAREAAARRAA